MKRILVLNTSSGSQHCTLFELPDRHLPDEPPVPVWEARLETTAPGQPEDRLRIRMRSHDQDVDAGWLDAQSSSGERIRTLLDLLWRGPADEAREAQQIDAAAHRVMHGGSAYDCATRVTAAVEAQIELLAAFAPMHNAINLEGIRAAQALMHSSKLQVAVFDTAFHLTLPDAAATYPGPYDWREQGIRRYGFHGTSFRYASEKAARMLNRTGDEELRLIICHLGGGCSLCATVGGRSIDTTMGLTPLDGLAMCTRSGSLDPGILIHLLREGITIDNLEHMLHRESGLKGLSGTVGDTRELIPAASEGNPRAQLALGVFIHRLRAGIGQMMASLGKRPDAIVFTDAIGVDEPLIRAAACEPFEFLGLQLDWEKNASSPLNSDLAVPESKVRVLLIESQETWQIAREAHNLITGSQNSDNRAPSTDRPISTTRELPSFTSARAAAGSSELAHRSWP